VMSAGDSSLYDLPIASPVNAEMSSVAFTS